ncbi:hypothetical protein EZS27_035547 [termite gut metagenome]|uniref:Uncharacterized protein n=1 Tax=termite gut metagenome TaxID=433724 RepID=A0A5J4PYS8_9ZZZZ
MGELHNGLLTKPLCRSLSPFSFSPDPKFVKEDFLPVVHLANINFNPIYLSVQDEQIQVLNHR